MASLRAAVSALAAATTSATPTGPGAAAVGGALERLAALVGRQLVELIGVHRGLLWLFRG